MEGNTGKDHDRRKERNNGIGQARNEEAESKDAYPRLHYKALANNILQMRPGKATGSNGQE